MKLVVVTQEIAIEPFLINELNEIAGNFDDVIIITTQKKEFISHKYQTIISKKSDFFFSCFFYALAKLFSQEARHELKDIRKLRVRPSFKSIVLNWLKTWMIEKRLEHYLNETWKGDSIVLYSYWLNCYSYFVAKTKKRYPQITAVSRAHGFEIRDFDSYIPFRRAIDENLDMIIFISDYTKREYESIMARIASAKRAEQYIFRLGVNRLNSLPFKTYIPGQIFNIVSCSGIYELKRLDLIIEAIRILSDTIEIKWDHFGSGPENDIIQELARNRLSNNNVTFNFKGQSSNEEVLSYYEKNRVDVFVNTSDYEGIPVSVMEAMSYGIPCLARDIGGNGEIVLNKISGVLLPGTVTPEIIAESLKQIFILIQNERGKYLALRESTMLFWENHFNGKKNYKIFVNTILNNTEILNAG